MIIRTRNSAETLPRVLDAVAAQTVAAEIVVVDSGSTDDTMTIVRGRADRLVEIPAGSFSFGGALNAGASVASSSIHMALSSHSLPPNDEWIARSLAKYERNDVAATSGAPTFPGSRMPLQETYHQRFEDALAHPEWGLSNTGSSWRADVWGQFPFDERLAACEDKEWGLRVLRAGWSIAIDPSLSVSDRHRRRHGMRDLYRRTYREYAAIHSFAAMPSYALDDLLREWMCNVPHCAPYFGWRRRLNYFRCVELLAKYRAARAPSSHACSPASMVRPDGPRIGEGP